MNRILLVLALCTQIIFANSQVAYDTLAIQDFEPVPSTPTMTFTTPLADTINGYVPVAPPYGSFELGVDGSSAWHMVRNINGYVGFTNAVEFDNVTIPTGYDSIRASFQLAAFSRTDSIWDYTQGGTDNLDYVLFEYSLNNGATYTGRIRIRGYQTQGAYWPYTASGSLQLPHLPAVEEMRQPTTAAGLQDAEGYSYCEIVFPGNITELRLRITPRSSAGGDHWCMDNILIVGEYPCTPTTSSFNITNCGSYIAPSGAVYTSTGVYQDTIFNTAGCDSIMTISANIPPLPNTMVIQTGNTLSADASSFGFQWLDCDDSFSEILGANMQDFTPTVSGNYAVRLDNGCLDTSTCYSINLNSADSVIIDTSLCLGESINVNGVTYNTTGSFIDTLSSDDGLSDSIYYVTNLVINSPFNSLLNPVICAGGVFVFNGTSYDTTGSYLDTIPYAISGCDSLLVTINITIPSTLTTPVDTSFCEGESLMVNGITYNTTGSYLDTLAYTNAPFCDSIINIINLVVLSTDTIVIDTTLCDGEILLVNGMSYLNSGSYTDQLSYTNYNCDSLFYQINLGFDTAVSIGFNSTICAGESYNLNGGNYNASGTYFDTLSSVSAPFCDSIYYTLNLTVLNVDTVVIDTAVCSGDSVQVNNNWYATAGTYFDTIMAIGSACDSIQFQINVSVNTLPIVQGNTNIIGDSICENDQLILTNNGAPGVSYSWNNGITNGVGFTMNSGLSTFVLEGVSGTNCFDYDTITVTGIPTYSSQDSVTVCGAAFYVLGNGDTVLTTGNYVQNLQSTLFLCDSTVSTFVEFVEGGNFEPLIDATICEGFTTTLSVTAQNMNTFEWFVNDGGGYVSTISNASYSGANTNELTFNIDTTLNNYLFRVNMTDACGNSFSDELTLEVNSPVEIQNPTLDQTVCAEDSVVIFLDYAANNYVWNTGEIGNSLAVGEGGTFIVTFTDSITQCALSDTFTITVDNCLDKCMVAVPSGFSPNGDGMNDVFKVINSCNLLLSDFEFSLYNKWGERLFFSNEPLQGWDGIYQTKLVSIGVYNYYIQFEREGNSDLEVLKGNITVIK